MRLPAKDSAVWRAIITAIQTFAGFVVALAATPEAMELITNFYPWVVPVVVSGAGIASLLLNIFRSTVKNY